MSVILIILYILNKKIKKDSFDQTQNEDYIFCTYTPFSKTEFSNKSIAIMLRLI